MHRPGVEISKLIEKARRLYLTTKDGISDADMAKELGVSHRTANRYRLQLGGIETFQNSAKYTLKPSEEEIEFAKKLLQRSGFRIQVDYKAQKELEEQLREEMITDDY